MFAQFFDRITQVEILQKCDELIVKFKQYLRDLQAKGKTTITKEVQPMAVLNFLLKFLQDIEAFFAEMRGRGAKRRRLS